MEQQFTVRENPCIDKYPPGKEYVQNVVTSLRDAKLKAAFKVSSIWKTDRLRIHFMDGTPKQREWVKTVVNTQLAPIASKLTFIWDVPIQESDIRISFATPKQAWSYLGSDALQIPKNQKTMNLGWIDDDVQFDSPAFKNTGQVVLHEFCHALGMIHEHQNPKNNTIEWNKPVIYEELRRTNNWSPQQVDNNMFKKYGDKEMCERVKSMAPYPNQKSDIEGYCKGEEVNGSEYDPTSIMHYWYPPRWILSGNAQIPVNTKLSELDKIWIARYYGNPPTEPTNPETINPEPTIVNPNPTVTETNPTEVVKESYIRLLRDSATDFIVDFIAFLLLFGGYSLIIYLFVRQSKRH